FPWDRFLAQPPPQAPPTTPTGCALTARPRDRGYPCPRSDRPRPRRWRRCACRSPCPSRQQSLSRKTPGQPPRAIAHGCYGVARPRQSPHAARGVGYPQSFGVSSVDIPKAPLPMRLSVPELQHPHPIKFKFKFEFDSRASPRLSCPPSQAQGTLMSKVRIGVMLAVALAGAAAIVWWLADGHRQSDELRLYGNVDLREADVPFNASERVRSE